MIKNFFYRLLLVVTIIVIAITLCMNFDSSSILATSIMCGISIILAIVSFITFKNMPEEKLNEVLMKEKLKKIGIDLDED